MKVQYISDIHLRHPQNNDYLKNNKLIPNGDILIIAGDTLGFNDEWTTFGFMQFCANEFKQTYIVPGNHDWYSTNIKTLEDFKIDRNIFPNTKIINNNTVVIDNNNFIFSTMWTHVPTQYAFDVYNGLNDFNYIKYKGKKITVNDYNEFHTEHLFFITNAVKPEMNKIIVTHHVPTFAVQVEKYKGDRCNNAFYTELFDFIENTNISHWIYGHNHFCNDMKIGNTELVSNQLGYIKYNEHGDFKLDKYFEI